MRRMFYLLVLTLMPMLVYAGNVTVVSGNLKSLVMEEPSIGYIVFDFSQTVVEDKETVDEYLARRGEDYVRDWPDVQYEMATYFCAQYNFRNRKALKGHTGMYMMVDEDEADNVKHAEFEEGSKEAERMGWLVNEDLPIYRLVFHITAVDFGSTSSAVVKGVLGAGFGGGAKAGGASFVGIIDIINTSTNEVVCTMEVEKTKGGSSYSETGRLESALLILAKDLVGAAKKSK